MTSNFHTGQFNRIGTKALDLTCKNPALTLAQRVQRAGRDLRLGSFRRMNMKTISKWQRVVNGAMALWISGCGGVADPERGAVIETKNNLANSGAFTDVCAPTPNSEAQVGDAVYLRYATNKTWTEAKSECEAMGGRLAVPFDTTTNSAILTASSGANVFIGAQQSLLQTNPSDAWSTIDGTPLEFTNWSGSGPTDGNDGVENDETDCARLNGNDGSWDETSCLGTTGDFICEFAEQPVACGGTATCGIASGDTTYRCACATGQKYDPVDHRCYGGELDLDVTYLEFLGPTSGNVYVNFPFRAKVGLKGTGNTAKVQVNVGLMEKASSGAAATDEEIATLRSCVAASGHVEVVGDGSQQYLEVSGIVPPECLGTDAQRTANLYVMLDIADEDTTETDPWLVFNEREAQTTLGQTCSSPDPLTGQLSAGCVREISIQSSPGLDIALESAAPSSSVSILESDDLSTENARPLAVLDVAVAAYGRDYDEPNADLLPQAVDFTYHIVADPDPSEVGWKQLDSNAEGTSATISELEPGELHEVEARLHPTTEIRTLMSQGGAWSTATNYKLRACASVPFGEQSDPSVGGSNGLSNNCQEYSIVVVPAETSTSSLSSYDVSKTYQGSWGSSSSMQLVVSGGSSSSFDVMTGAYSENELYAQVNGFFGSVKIAEGWGNGYAQIDNASVDAGLKVLGSQLYGYSRDYSSITFGKTVSYSKEKCLRYVYGTPIVGVTIQGCFGVEAGLAATLNITPSSITPQVRPYAGAYLDIDASLNAAIFRVSASGNLTLADLNSQSSNGVSSTLSFTKPSANSMTISFDVNANMRISTLSGRVGLEIEQIELGICRKKKWGITIKYPCYSWDTVAEYTLFSFGGVTFQNTLLDRTLASYTLNY
jgi:hypothetical protein